MPSYLSLRSLFIATILAALLASPMAAEIGPDPADRVVGKKVTLSVANQSLDNHQPIEKGVGMPVSLVVDDGVAENFIGDSGQFIWLNRFTPAAADFPFQLDEVSVVFGTTNVVAGDDVEILVYSDTDADGDPATGSALVGTCNDVVQTADGATFNVYTCPNVVLSGPGDVLIGVVNRYGSEGFDDFPAALDQTASNMRSWAATYLAGDVPANPTLPGDEQWGTIDSFGFPGNWIIRGSGTTVAPDTLPIPTQSPLGMVLFVLALVLAAVTVLWRRSVQSAQ